jgi:hypothetical protein
LLPNTHTTALTSPGSTMAGQRLLRDCFRVLSALQCMLTELSSAASALPPPLSLSVTAGAGHAPLARDVFLTGDAGIRTCGWRTRTISG